MGLNFSAEKQTLNEVPASHANNLDGNNVGVQNTVSQIEHIIVKNIELKQKCFKIG